MNREEFKIVETHRPSAVTVAVKVFLNQPLPNVLLTIDGPYGKGVHLEQPIYATHASRDAQVA